MKSPVFVTLTATGLELARRLQPLFPASEVRGRRGRADDADLVFTETVPALRSLFEQGRPILGVCAAGILIRALAPQLAEKRSEPPVIALAEDGGAVVPLLGGHRGANALAQKIAKELGIEAAVTTAGERRFGIALDDPPAGWILANPQDHKAFAAALLDGATIRLTCPAVTFEQRQAHDKAMGDELNPSHAKLGGQLDWLLGAELPISDEGELEILVTEELAEGSVTRLVYHPQALALGLGCERGCEASELHALLQSTMERAGLSPSAVAGIFSLDLKSDEAAIHAVAAELGVPARFYDAEALEAQSPRLANPSEAVFREVGVHGVAEGAALAASGREGALLVPKTKSARATCAVARAPTPIDVEASGVPRGRLLVIGTGPGKVDWRTAESMAGIAEASDVVGYRLYLDLLGSTLRDKQRHDFELGEEEARVCHALALASEGRCVALVSSGDPGIYAMASLVFEVLEACEKPDWLRVAIEVLPGISALQAAAARVGAPLGHDFCSISLSDLLTPWSVIERRLEAAAQGDFVVALYNPVSQRRRHQLVRAKEILLAQRPADTPVILASRLGREGEALRVIDLAELEADEIDMLTLVLVGSSTTRRVLARNGGVWVYTPRGYGAGETRRKAKA